MSGLGAAEAAPGELSLVDFDAVRDASPERRGGSVLKWRQQSARELGNRALAAAVLLVGAYGLAILSADTGSVAEGGSRVFPPPAPHPQCLAPYETLGGVGAGAADCCSPGGAGACDGHGDWRRQNKRTHPEEGGAPPPPLLHCDLSSEAPVGVRDSEGFAVTGVGGGQWYRFGGSWDSLPTNPGGFEAGTPGFRGPQFCDAAASAWVSGWPADETDDPPPDYAVPGSLPGDGPQYLDAQWQERVVCFEGTRPAAAAAGSPPPPSRAKPRHPDQPGVLWELWRDVRDHMLSYLFANRRFPDRPTERFVVGPEQCVVCNDTEDQGRASDRTPDCRLGDAAARGPSVGVFESPTNIAEDIGTRMRAYFRAPATGCYTFLLATDDDGELWVGGDDDEGEALAPTLVATVPGWTGPREWDRFEEQTSQPVRMQAGRYYMLDAFAKEQHGGDNLAVGVTLPDNTPLADGTRCTGEQCKLWPIPVQDYLFVDAALRRPPRGGDDSDGSVAPAPSGAEYQSCLASARVRVVHCGDFLLWQLPDVPSCDEMAMAYCTVESELFPHTGH